MDLAAECYAATRAFPPSEIYGMTGQIRRASASVAANIAEGHGRESRGTFIQFLRVAQGSLKELETHLILAERVGLLEKKVMADILGRSEETGRMLRSMIRSLQSKQ
jgi:four helix bundle protein